MIVADTSIWITARRQPLLAKALQELIEADEITLALPVRLELLAGIPKHQRAKFRRVCSSVPQLYPTEETWTSLSGLIERASDAGEHFGLIDLTIASMTAEIGGLAWSLDKDFERMERLGFVSLYALPH